VFPAEPEQKGIAVLRSREVIFHNIATAQNTVSLMFRKIKAKSGIMQASGENMAEQLERTDEKVCRADRAVML